MTAQAPRKYPRTARVLGAVAALFAILGFAAPGLLVLAAWLALVAYILAKGVSTPSGNVSCLSRTPFEDAESNYQRFQEHLHS